MNASGSELYLRCSGHDVATPLPLYLLEWCLILQIRIGAIGIGSEDVNSEDGEGIGDNTQKEENKPHITKGLYTVSY